MRNSIKLPTDQRPIAQRQRLFARAANAGFDVHAAGGATEITLYDEIGPWGVTAAAFKAKLASVTGNIVLMSFGLQYWLCSSFGAAPIILRRLVWPEADRFSRDHTSDV